MACANPSTISFMRNHPSWSGVLSGNQLDLKNIQFLFF
jgi:hypothetical protein